MKNYCFVLLFLPLYIFSQESIGYIPPRPSETSAEDYRKGTYILEGAYQQIRESDGKWIYADYWNVAVGYHYIGVEPTTVISLLKKSYESDPASFCELQRHLGKSQKFYDLGEEYQVLVGKCSATEPEISSAELSPEAYCQTNNYDQTLVSTLDSLLKQDQLYRGKPGYGSNQQEVHLQQEKIDPSNLTAILAIIQKHGYPGKDLVGSRYAAHAGLIIEHAIPHDTATTGNLLPVLAVEAQNGNLPPSMFRLLVDRYYLITTQTQIYGSQAGIPFASDDTIKAVKSRFNIP